MTLGKNLILLIFIGKLIVNTFFALKNDRADSGSQFLVQNAGWLDSHLLFQHT